MGKATIVSTQNLPKYDAQAEENFAWFWVKMDSAYQGTWRKDNGLLKSDNPEATRWKRTLAALNIDQIKVAIKNLPNRTSEWPPSRIEFTRMAKQRNYESHKPFPMLLSKGTEAGRKEAAKVGLAEARQLMKGW